MKIRPPGIGQKSVNPSIESFFDIFVTFDKNDQKSDRCKTVLRAVAKSGIGSVMAEIFRQKSAIFSTF